MTARSPGLRATFPPPPWPTYPIVLPEELPALVPLEGDLVALRATSPVAGSWKAGDLVLVPRADLVRPRGLATARVMPWAARYLCFDLQTLTTYLDRRAVDAVLRTLG